MEDDISFNTVGNSDVIREFVYKNSEQILNILPISKKLECWRASIVRRSACSYIRENVSVHFRKLIERYIDIMFGFH